MPELPLWELRVVEIGSGDALCYCGKLFADFGAEVIKVEPPGGDAARKIAPLVDAGDGARESATFAWLNTNKRSITADLTSPADVATIRTLLGSSDLLLDARPPAIMRNSAISHETLRQSEPGLAITAISWFGEADLTAIMRRRIRCAAALLVWSNWSARSKGRRCCRATDRSPWSPG
jgi:crotonobetainyl-CoA:carnitine CoA-transferase CaiB-like acyl-CoA transferase